MKQLAQKFLPALAVVFFALSLARCAGAPKFKTETLSHRPAEPNLSQFQAAERSKRVSDVSYKLYFDLDEKRETYTGKTTAQFLYRPTQDGFKLTIDFEKATLKSLIINGVKAETITANDAFITLPDSLLRAGLNTVEIDFEKSFSKSGDGFYRFKDPEDGSIYLFTDFEPYNANKLFPCFDQPDLKATYTLDVLAPPTWQVISAARENNKITKSGKTQWSFPTTLPFSTYIFSLHAGPYQMWSSQAKTNKGTIPLRLFARKTLAQYVDSRGWFKVSAQGFQFFNDYFDYPYPFKKYDQVIVPDFNAGAMENVGAVTFSERFVFRGEPTRSQLLDRADVILHEMAHMWFGNLVTMQWWNDLWLNESFATFMAALASVEATEFKEAWQVFYEDTKTWAYWEDGLVTTHPIEGKVTSTDQAFASFDGITYGKGASVLKQVSHLIGPQAFKEGVRSYFKEFACKNAERKDFVNSLQKASQNVSLANWTKEWLQTESFNKIQTKTKCDAGKISAFEIQQSVEDSKYSTLRTHKTKIGLYKRSEGQFSKIKDFEVLYSGASTKVKDAIGLDCPDFVLPNEEDYDYVKVTFDPQSLILAPEAAQKMSSSQHRSIIWHTLWEMVRDGQYPLMSFAEKALAHLGNEKEFNAAQFLAQKFYGRRATSTSVLFYMPDHSDKLAHTKNQFTERLEKFFWSQLSTAKAQSDFQKLWFDSFVKTASSVSAQKLLAQVLKGSVQFAGLKVDQDRRWDIIWTLSANGFDGVSALIATELKRDRSEQGQKKSISAEAASPDVAKKKAWIEKLLAQNPDMSFARMRSVLSNLFPRNQMKLRGEFRDLFFSRVPALHKAKGDEFADAFTEYVAPTTCSSDSVSALGNFVSSNGDLPPIVLKNIRVAKQEDEKCMRVRALAEKNQ